jgi:hypothetical protein
MGGTIVAATATVFQALCPDVLPSTVDPAFSRSHIPAG